MRPQVLALLPVLLIAFGCSGGGTAHSAPEVPIQTLLSSIPEELRDERPNLAPEENGWLILAKGYDTTPRIAQDTISLFDDPSNRMDLLRDPIKKAKVDEAFEEFSKPMTATKEGLALDRRALLSPAPGANSTVVLKGLRVQLSLFTFRAAFRLASGEVDNAVSDYGTCVGIVQQLSSSGAPIDYAVIAGSLWTRINREIRWAACHPKMTESGLRKLLALLPGEDVILEDFERSIRAELYQFIQYEVLRLKGPGATMLMSRDAKESYRDFDSGWDKADEVAAHILEGHKEPFDRIDTVDSAVLIFSELIKNVRRKWREQVPTTAMISSLVKDWPISRLLGASGESDAAKKELEAARPKLMAAQNPYGRFALWFFLPVSDHSAIAPFRARTDLNATRIIVAARVFKSQKGQFPKALDDLKIAGIIGEIPEDPFSDKAFNFDAGQARIWSAGPNTPDASLKVGAPSSIRQDFSWSLADIKEVQPNQESLKQEFKVRSAGKKGPLRPVLQRSSATAAPLSR